MKAYVYQIIVDGVVRYIGKGTGRRALSHIAIVRGIIRRRAAGEAVQATHFQNRLAKAYRNGADIQIEIVADSLSDAAAFDLEVTMIAARRGLWNMTTGGDAPPRMTGPRSAEHRAKITASNKATWADPDLRQRQADTKKVHWLRPEYREAVSAPRGKKPVQSAAASKRWADPKYRAKMERTHSDPAFSLRRSEATKRGWQTRRATAK